MYSLILALITDWWKIIQILYIEQISKLNFVFMFNLLQVYRGRRKHSRCLNTEIERVTLFYIIRYIEIYTKHRDSQSQKRIIE